MNQIPVIRKGAIKDYWVNGVGGGFIVGLIFFLITLINSSFRDAVIAGLAFWIGIAVLFIGVGFPSEEYFKRKIRIKELTSLNMPSSTKTDSDCILICISKGPIRDSFSGSCP